jgi:SAM-dependent methyltransferase
MDVLNYIFKKYQIHWRAKPPIEIPNVDRVSLAKLFRELGYKVGAEIGVEEGRYSKVLSQRNRGVKLYCIDPWLSDGVYRKQFNQAYIDNLMANAIGRLARYNCEIIRKTSMDAVKDFKDESLDFVYIDGNHKFEYVVNDLAEWSKKVRPGGIVSGHDWIRIALSSTTKNNDPIEVQAAVRGFVDAYRIRPLFIVGTNAVVEGQLRDKVRSWFWVKQ